MKIAVVCEDDNGIKSVWYPDITDEQWYEMTKDYTDSGTSVAGTIDQVLDDIKEAFC